MWGKKAFIDVIRKVNGSPMDGEDWITSWFWIGDMASKKHRLT